MAKSESDIFTPRTGQVIQAENGTQYFVCGNNRIKISEHFAAGGKLSLIHILIPNISNLADGVKNLPYDPDNTYSVPYFWGSVGIVYNQNTVDAADLENEGWNILKDEKYADKIYMYDSERDSFMVAFKALGYSMNTQNEAEIQAAYQWLLEQRKTMNPAYVADEVIDGMINGNEDMAVVYSLSLIHIFTDRLSILQKSRWPVLLNYKIDIF